MGRLPNTRNQLALEVGESVNFRCATYKTNGIPEGKRKRKKMKCTLVAILSTVVVLCFAVSAWATQPIKVDCNKGDSISATLAHLAQTGNTRGITILVSGTCKENLSISRFDRLVLQASPRAMLQDASNGNAAVVNIVSSYDVTLQGFEINGGAVGVLCWYFSFCTLNDNTVQQSGSQGVLFGRSEGLLQGNNIANNATFGLEGRAAKLQTYANTINNNGDSGIDLNASNLTATSDTITGNANFGINLLNNSVVRAFDLTINGNSNSGVRLASASTAEFRPINTGNVITGNGGIGVSVNDLSFARFFGTDTVSGNLTQPDVACNPQYSATRGAHTVGGTTNCPN